MFSSDAQTAEADYTLARLYEEGTEALSVDSDAIREGEEVSPMPAPKATYEVAEGVVGTMPFPRLGIRETISDINAEHVQPLFQEDADPDDIRALSSDDDNEVAEGAKNSIREGVTTQEFTNTIQRVNCLQATEILEFDGDAPDPEDVNPQMASVVVNHFTALRPGTTNGQSGS